MGGKVIELEVITAHRQGLAEGKTEEREENIAKLAAHYMSTDPSLSKEEATEIASKILA